MAITLDEKAEQKIKRAAEHTGLSDSAALNRAIDVFLFALEMEDINQLQADTEYWESLYRETLVLEEKRDTNLSDD